MTSEDREGAARYAMSDDDVARQFPYGLPTWLQGPASPRQVAKDDRSSARIRERGLP